MLSHLIAVAFRDGETVVKSPEWVSSTPSRRGKVSGLRTGSMLVTCWVMPSMFSTSWQLMEELLITAVNIFLWRCTLSAGMQKQEVAALSPIPSMTPCCFNVKALSRLSRGAKGELFSLAKSMYAWTMHSLVHLSVVTTTKLSRVQWR